MVKKFLAKSLVFIAVLFFAVAPNFGFQGAGFINDSGMVQASSTTTGAVTELVPPIVTAGGGGVGLEGIIKNITGFIFWLGIVICPILIVWAGFTIATAGDDQNKVSQGKQMITYAIVGLVIIAVSSAMVTAIQNILK